MADTVRIGDRDIPLRDTWSTPQWLVDRLDDRWGFGLDAAATKDTAIRPSSGNARLDYLGPDHGDPDRRDALGPLVWASVDWPEGYPVFLNPPFSQTGGGLTAWVNACIAQATAGPVVAILPDTPSCRWFRRAWESAYEVTLFDGRVAFVPPPGVKTSSPTGGVVVFAWVPRVDGPARVRWESLPGRREVSDG